MQCSILLIQISSLKATCWFYSCAYAKVYKCVKSLPIITELQFAPKTTSQILKWIRVWKWRSELCILLSNICCRRCCCWHTVLCQHACMYVCVCVRVCVFFYFHSIYATFLTWNGISVFIRTDNSVTVTPILQCYEISSILRLPFSFMFALSNQPYNCSS